MKKIATFCFILLFSSAAFAQVITFKHSFGFADYSYGASALQLPDSSYVLLGNSGNADGNANLLFIRTDQFGVPTQHKIHSDGVLYHGEKIRRAANGDFLVTGTQKAVGESYQPFWMRLDSAFNLLWHNTLACNNWTFCYDLQELPDQTIIAVGETYDTENGDLDQLLVKLTADGEITNVIKSELTGNDGFHSIEMWNEQSLLVGGYQQDTASLDTVPMFGFIDFDGNIQMRRLFDDVSPKSVVTQALRAANDKVLTIGYTNRYRTDNNDLMLIFFDSTGTLFDDQIVGDLSFWQNSTCAYRSAAVSTQGNLLLAIQVKGGNWTHESINLHCLELSYPNYYFLVSGTVDDLHDEIFVSQVIATNDGLFALVGTTFACSVHNSDILFVKFNEDLDKIAENDHFLPVKDYDVNTAISIFPNPTSDFLTVHDSQPSGDNSIIELYNANMQLLARWQHQFTENPDFQINVTNYQSGFYVLKVTNSARCCSKKIIIW